VIILPHGMDETRLLRNLSLNVPAPIVEHYDFPSADGKRPFDKQVLTAASMTMNPYSYVLNDMGTGKTKACIWSFDWLRKEGLANRMLVTAPLSTLHFTWEREIFQTFPRMKVKVLTGSRERRKRLLEEDADIFIVNHDGLKVIHNEIIRRRDIDVICFDEAAAYRNARADRSKVARAVARGRSYVWGMTGSPTPTAPTDAYGLAHLITPAAAPRSWVQFRQNTMHQVSQFRWVPRKDAAETVSKILQPSVRYSLDDVTELPPVIVRDYEVEMSKEQKKAYEELRLHATALLKEGTLTAVNGGVTFSKMLQTSCGWLYIDTDKGRVTSDLKPVPRLEALLDLIEAAEHKVLVFSPFKSATAGIASLLGAEKIDFATVTGDTSTKDRADIFQAFQHTDKYHVLNAHPECMSHGLTLTAADTVIWYGPVTKLETYEQANARITRVGQAHKQQIIRMQGTAAERSMYTRLANRQDMQDSILEIIEEITKGV